MSPRTDELLEALRVARAEIKAAIGGDGHRRAVAGVLIELDRALAMLDRSQAKKFTLVPVAEASGPADSDLDQLRREIERLQALESQERGFLDAVLAQSPHGVIICDANGKLVLQNRASERIWAGSAQVDAIEDWVAYRAFHPDGRPYLAGDWVLVRCLLVREPLAAEEVHVQRFDGTHGVLLAGAAPVFDALGELMGAALVFVDITELKRLEQIKDRWIAVAGHEMRAPLAAMKLRVDLTQHMLARGQGTAEELVPKTLDLVLEQTERLNLMVGDMLDLSRAQSGTLQVEPADVALAPLVTRVMELLLPGSPQHRGVVEVAPELVVHADPRRTEQLLVNLVGNAIRYSPNGGELSVRARAVVDGGGQALVQIRDAGVGFDPAAAPHLFEPYVQVRAGTRRESGLGLGLYLARELVTRMGGRIWGESAGAGQGATFSFTLPLASPVQAAS